MSNGGINPIKEVILYPRKFNVAPESRTPNATTINGTAIARTDLKKNKRTNAVTNAAKPTNNFISAAVARIVSVRI